MKLACSSTSPDTTDTKFTGKLRDNESGLDYFGARYFSGAQGRFTTPDTAPPDLNNPQSWNRYSYALNNPLRMVDRDGDLYVDVYRFQYTVTWTETDKQGNTTTYSALITVYVDVVYNDNGTVAGVDSSAYAVNQKGATVNISDKKLANMASTAAALVRNSLGANLGNKLTTDAAKVAMANAVGTQETRLGINGTTNPLQLSSVRLTLDVLAVTRGKVGA